MFLLWKKNNGASICYVLLSSKAYSEIYKLLADDISISFSFFLWGRLLIYLKRFYRQYPMVYVLAFGKTLWNTEVSNASWQCSSKLIKLSSVNFMLINLIWEVMAEEVELKRIKLREHLLALEKLMFINLDHTNLGRQTIGWEILFTETDHEFNLDRSTNVKVIIRRVLS